MRSWLDFARRPGAGAWKLSRAGTALALALAAGGCASAASDGGAPAASPRASSPPLYRAPGGGYVPGSTTYHGTGGP